MSSNTPRKYELKVVLVNCKQSSMSVSAYYAKLKKIGMNWFTINSYRHVVCGMINELIKQHEEDKVH